MPSKRRIRYDKIRVLYYLTRARSQGPVWDDEAINKERPQYARRFIGFFLQSCRPQALCCDAPIEVQDRVAGFDRFD